MVCSQWWGFVMWSELGHRIVWYIHGYECFGGAFWFCLHRPSDDGSNRSRPNRLCWPFTLHGPITEKTTILNLNIIHFSCIVSLCHKNLCTQVILHYTFVWAAKYRRKPNENIMVYCLMKVCIYFVMVLKLYIFSAVTHSRRWWGVVVAWQLATLPMLCYIIIIIIIIIINIKDWTLWSVPSPQLQLFAPTLLRSSNCSPSLWSVVVWFERDSVWWHSLQEWKPVPSVFIYLVYYACNL